MGLFIRLVFYFYIYITNLWLVCTCNRRKKKETQKLAFLEDEMCHDVEYWRQKCLSVNWMDYTWITNNDRAWFNEKEWNLYNSRRRLNQIETVMSSRPRHGRKDTVTTKKKKSRSGRDFRDDSDEQKGSNDALSNGSASDSS